MAVQVAVVVVVYLMQVVVVAGYDAFQHNPRIICPTLQ
jgi:hypothetical protein